MTSTTSEVHAALRAWARGTYPTEAATELLIRSGLVSTGDRWVQPGDDPGWWWINFEALTQALNAGTAHSGGERRVLSIAASLGGHTPDGFALADALAGLDRKHLALVLAAVAHAGGSHQDRDTSALEQAAAAGQPVDRSMLAGQSLGSLHTWPEHQTGPPEPVQWTVGQLRAELVGLADNTLLVIDVPTSGTVTRRHPITGAGFGPGIDPADGVFAGQEFPLLAGSRPLPDTTGSPGRADLTWPGVDRPPISDQGIAGAGE